MLCLELFGEFMRSGLVGNGQCMIICTLILQLAISAGAIHTHINTWKGLLAHHTLNGGAAEPFFVFTKCPVCPSLPVLLPLLFTRACNN